jgi:hypothetical protein
MAYSLKSYPDNTASLNNEMLFVVHESTKANDPVNYPDYSYVADVYVNSVLVERMIARPDPTYQMGIFDVSRALQPYVTYGFNAGNNKVSHSPKLDYQVKFGEQYNGTLYTNILTDSARSCLKTYATRPFTSSTVLTDGKASNAPATVRIHRSEWLLFNYYRATTQKNYEIVYSDGITDIGSGTLGVNVSGEITQYNFGLDFQAIPAAAVSALIRDQDANVVQDIEFLCSKHPIYTLVWLNPYGAYDSQTFAMTSKKVIELERRDYTPLNYRLDASGVISYGNNMVFYGGKKGYATMVKVKLQLTSHLLNDGEYTWLADLFASPEVYIYNDNTGLGQANYFIPVTITANNYEYRTYKNSRLTPLQFEVEFADQYNAQYL